MESQAMGPVLDSLYAGLPYMVLHVAVTVGVLVAGVTVYIWVTPFREIHLIREGNTAAAISFMGAVLGLAIPLAFSLAGSVTALDILIWGAVVVILQLIAFRLVDLLIRDISQRIENDEVPAAIALLTGKLAVAAIISAAVLS
jgi:putative membrane protein